MTSNEDAPDEQMKLVGQADGKQAHEETRRDALTAYLEERVAAGFVVESRTGTQAVIRAPRRVASLFRRREAEDRQVVQVDEHGAVTTSPASPRRS
jgi:hypothetical protein